MSQSFSTGFTFIYWDKYFEDAKSEDVDYYGGIKMEYGEYDPKALLIRPKYKDFKEEIEQNDVYPLDSKFFDLSLRKANRYIDTKFCRKQRAHSVDDNWRFVNSSLLSIQTCISS